MRSGCLIAVMLATLTAHVPVACARESTISVAMEVRRGEEAVVGAVSNSTMAAQLIGSWTDVNSVCARTPTASSPGRLQIQAGTIELGGKSVRVVEAMRVAQKPAVWRVVHAGSARSVQDDAMLFVLHGRNLTTTDGAKTNDYRRCASAR